MLVTQGFGFLVILWRLASGQFSNFSAILSTLTPLNEPDEWDVMNNGTLHIHLVDYNYSISNPFRDGENDTIAYWYTRVYCYSDNAYNFSYDTCGIPGPTIIFRPNNETQEVVLHNHLIGIGKHVAQTGNGAQKYKDPDTANIHVHGLHVSPHVDNIVDVEVLPICPDDITDGADYVCWADGTVGNHSYPYVIPSTHYPGTHWYHAHWVSTQIEELLLFSDMLL